MEVLYLSTRVISTAFLKSLLLRLLRNQIYLVVGAKQASIPLMLQLFSSSLNGHIYDPNQSDSQQSLQEQPDWRKMRRVLAKAKNENPLNRVILKGFEAVSAQNVLLKAEIEGLKETVVLQKQWAVRRGICLRS